MVIRALTADAFDAVHEAFNAAFSDYLVPLSLTREQLAEMMRRRGWLPEASIASSVGRVRIGFAELSSRAG
jgi:hypothetical protein